MRKSVVIESKSTKRALLFVLEGWKIKKRIKLKYYDYILGSE